MEKIGLNLKIENITKEQAVAIVNMMQEMERFGYIGHSAYVGLFADGDGSFHPKVSHDLPYTTDELREFRDETVVYEDHHRTHGGGESFPWTSSITLFDFDNLNLTEHK